MRKRISFEALSESGEHQTAWLVREPFSAHRYSSNGLYRQCPSCPIETPKQDERSALLVTSAHGIETDKHNSLRWGWSEGQKHAALYPPTKRRAPYLRARGFAIEARRSARVVLPSNFCTKSRPFSIAIFIHPSTSFMQNFIISGPVQ